MKDLKNGFELTSQLFLVAMGLVLGLTILLSLFTRDSEVLVVYWTNVGGLWKQFAGMYLVCGLLMTLAHKIK